MIKKIKNRDVKKIIILMSCLLLISLFSACSLENEQAETNQSYKVIDAAGREVLLPHKPQRIVAMSIDIGESIMLMQKTENLIAVSYFFEDEGIVNMSAMAQNVPYRVDYSLESFLALDGDVVFIRDDAREEVKATLAEMDVPMIITKRVVSIDDIKGNIELIGKVLKIEDKAKDLIENIEADLESIKEKTSSIPASEKMVALRFSSSGSSGGKGTQFDLLCKESYMINGAAESGLIGSALLSKEQVITIDPDAIFIPTWRYKKDDSGEKLEQEIKEDPAYKPVKAIQNNRIFKINDRYFLSSSPYFVRGVKEVVKEVYNIEFAESKLDRILAEGENNG